MLIKPIGTIVDSHKSNEYLQPSTKVVLPIGNVYQLIPPDQILAVRSDSNYCTVMLQGKQLVLSKTLKWITKQLPDNQFIRLHRSYVVNIHEIVMIDKANSNLLLSNGLTIPISRERKKAIITWITSSM